MNCSSVSVYDCAPTIGHFREDVLEGLGSQPKSLPCKYFYDERGCSLFEQICELDEYYLTRTELEIMESFAGEMADAIGPECMLIEYGSGSSRKTRLLLDRLQRPTAYVPVDIAHAHLREAATQLARQYSELEVLPVCADFTTSFEPPRAATRVRRRVVYFPGSTIGNFEESQAIDLLRGIVRLVGPGGGLLIGFDLKKDTEVLEAAYNDELGITAEFNLNLLDRINRELKADFNLDRFEHRAVYDPNAGRIEIGLVSRKEQTVCVDGEQFDFAGDEAIHTEHSHKYRLEEFQQLAATAGCRQIRAWTDERKYFGVVLYAVPADD